MINKKWFVAVILSITLVNVVILFNLNLSNYHEALLGRALVLKNIIEKYEKEYGKFPEDLTCCLSELKAIPKEMYVFSLDKDDKLAFIYEYNSLTGGYMLIVGSYYPPNLIYISDTKELLFDSDLISQLF